MAIRTFYHGTCSARSAGIEERGLCRQQDPVLGGWNCPFITDSLEAARAYAQMNVRSHGGEPIIYAVDLEFGLQPNGSPQPPFYIDDWHRDSDMPGEAWEYDGNIAFEQLRVIDGPTLPATGVSFD